MISFNNKRFQFWLLQTSGWLLFLALILLFNLVRGALTFPIFVHYSTALAAGFLATLLLRLIYKKIKIQDRSILLLVLLAIVISALGSNLTIWITDLLEIHTFGMEPLPRGVYYKRVLWWLLPLTGWSALYIGLKFWQGWIIQKDKAEKAQALAQSAQLQMLRYRMNPHFLFNALNSIRALISENKVSAKTMVTELSEYLRYSLVSKNYENVPLKEEIESIRHYFNIQKMRYENKLEVSLDIDPEAEDQPIPSFLLHPLVENAVKYGMSTSPLPLKIQVNTRFRHGRLQIEIFNSGSWVEPASPTDDQNVGRGLENVRQRLAEAYPGNHHFEILEQGGGVEARLSIDTHIRR